MAETSEELKGGFELGSAEGMDHTHMGAGTVEDLGHATVDITTRAGIHRETVRTETFDKVQIFELAGTPVVVGLEAIRAEGEAHLLPTRIIPWGQVLGIDIPMDDGRLEAAGAERIGVNADGPD